jgi:hypothetical protein
MEPLNHIAMTVHDAKFQDVLSVGNFHSKGGIGVDGRGIQAHFTASVGNFDTKTFRVGVPDQPALGSEPALPWKNKDTSGEEY